MLLIVVFAAIAALAVTVVVDASKYFLAQRALASAADATAAAAAQSVDQAALYGGRQTDALPVSDDSVRVAAESYLRDAGVAAHFDQLTVTASTPDGFADAILHVLQAGAERQRISDAARARVLDRHSWGASMMKLDRLIGQLCAPGAIAP